VVRFSRRLPAMYITERSFLGGLSYTIHEGIMYELLRAIEIPRQLRVSIDRHILKTRPDWCLLKKIVPALLCS